MKILLTGTDPKTRKGGIGHALAGYLKALESVKIPYVSIPTYNPNSKRGKYLLWLRNLPKIYFTVRRFKKSGKYPVIYSHAGAGISLIREFFVLLTGKIAGAKTIIQLHALEVNNYLENSMLRFFLKNILWKPADVILVLTLWWENRLINGNVDKKIEIIPNPISHFLYKKAKEGLPEKKFKNKSEIKILTMTRLEKGKGVDVIVNAMQYLPDNMKLLIAGEGSQKKFLEQLVYKLNLNDKVIFLGWVEGSKKIEILEEADIFCLPSTLDSFGMGFVEAMSFGLPIVAVKWGPIADVVPDGKAGILVEKADPKLIAKALTQFVDSEKRYEFGQAGKKWVLEQFSPENIGEKLKEIIDNLSTNEG